MSQPKSFLKFIDVYEQYGHKLRGFERNGNVYIARCDYCLDVAVVKLVGDTLEWVTSNAYFCRSEKIGRSSFKIGWTNEDQKRFIASCGDRLHPRINRGCSSNGARAK